MALFDVEELDYLFLLSEPKSVFDNPAKSNGRLRRLARSGTRLGGVSGGVFPLARSGLLDGYQCSVHWCYEAAFAAEFPTLSAASDVMVIDRNRYTVSGAAAAFDLMLNLIEQSLSEDVATEVACWFQHPLMRGQGVRQKIPTFKSKSTSDMLPAAIARAVEMFANHIEDPVQVTDVASAVGLSPRQLERSFKAATGQSPLNYYRFLRMKAARQLVMYSRDTMTEIAGAVGYSSSSQLAKHYRAAFNISPQEERRKINLFRVERNRSIPSA